MSEKDDLFLENQTIASDPIWVAYGKATMDRDLEDQAKRVWFPPGSEEEPGLQDPSLIGGGGFIESMTTNYGVNNGCAANSFAIVNVKKHCDELLKNKKGKIPSSVMKGGCPAIMLWITKKLYYCYNVKKFGSQWRRPKYKKQILPNGGVRQADQFTILTSCKVKIMKELGIEDKMRLFGYTPRPFYDPNPLPQPRESVIIPPAVLTWATTGPGGGLTTPTSIQGPSNSAYGASACCPPIGCDVRITFEGTHQLHVTNGQTWSLAPHAVAGFISKCDPLTIVCQEHPLQSAGCAYTLTHDPNSARVSSRLSQMAARVSGAVGTITLPRVGTINMSELNGDTARIKTIICLCD